MGEELESGEQEYFESGDDSVAGAATDGAGGDGTDEPKPAAEPAPEKKIDDYSPIPYARFAEVIADKKELSSKVAKMEERFESFRQQIAARLQPQPEKRAEVSIDEDPIKYFQVQNEQLRNEVEPIRRELEQRNQHERFMAEVGTQVNQFKQTVPDYDAAYAHVVKMRDGELEAMGYSPAQRARIIQQDSIFISQSALRNERNPGQVVYEMAQKFGYKPVAKEQPAKSGDPGKQQSAIDPLIGKKIEGLKKGQEAAASLGKTSGDTEHKLTLERAVELTDAEWAKMSDAEIEKLLGGG